MKNKTIICHFYNEEYLLPWWLKHHRELFTDGVMINYGSDDKSVEIIKSLCPSWKIVDTKNEFFGALEIDREIEEYEKNIDGPRIVLNVTEFLIGNISKLESMEQIELYIPMASMVDLPEQHDTYPDTNIPLTEQRFYGINPRKYINTSAGSGSRILHETKNIVYPVGRHYWNTYNTNDFMILRYKHSPWNNLFIKRKMQIAKKQPTYDLARGWGIHHQFSLSQLNEEKNKYLSYGEDLQSIITGFEYWKY
jgi:hypothetical protein